MKNNAMIFGDSYSTFKDCVPEGYAVYYSPEDEKMSGVTNVADTWWHQVISEKGLELILNNSWSGSTICYTGYNGCDCSSSSSFIYRLRRLCEDGFFSDNEIDTVFVFGGTNDSWSNAPLGALKTEGVGEDDLYSVLPAIPYFFMSLKKALPRADIYCLINTDIKPEITHALEYSCELYGIKRIRFDKIEKKWGHPTPQGMKDIKDAVVAAMAD